MSALKLSAPTALILIIAIVLAVLAIVVKYGFVSFAPIAPYTFELLAIGFVVLAAGTVFNKA
jgi:hypothetical protein